MADSKRVIANPPCLWSYRPRYSQRTRMSDRTVRHWVVSDHRPRAGGKPSPPTRIRSGVEKGTYAQLTLVIGKSRSQFARAEFWLFQSEFDKIARLVSQVVHFVAGSCAGSIACQAAFASFREIVGLWPASPSTSCNTGSGQLFFWDPARQCCHRCADPPARF